MKASKATTIILVGTLLLNLVFAFLGFPETVSCSIAKGTQLMANSLEAFK